MRRYTKSAAQWGRPRRRLAARHVLTPAKHVAALQGVQQGEGRTH